MSTPTAPADPSLCVRGPRAQLVEALDHEHLRLEAIGGRGDRSAESEDGQRVAWRVDDLRAFTSPRPFRHHHLFGMDVLEAVLLHRLGCPRDGAGQVLRTTQPVTVRVGEFGEPLPRKIVGGGRLDKTRGGVTIGVDPTRTCLRAGIGGAQLVGLRSLIQGLAV